MILSKYVHFTKFAKNDILTFIYHVFIDTDGDERTHDVLVKIKTPADWDKGKIAEKMKERVEKDHKMNSSRDIQLIDFKFKCLLLKTKVSSYLLQNRSELMCAIGRFLKSILDDCEIDFSKPETIMITIDVQSSEALWRGMFINLYFSRNISKNAEYIVTVTPDKMSLNFRIFTATSLFRNRGNNVVFSLGIIFSDYLPFYLKSWYCIQCLPNIKIIVVWFNQLSFLVLLNHMFTFIFVCV